MKRRVLAWVLVLCMLAALPGALAEKSYSGRTSLSGASDGQRENILLAAEALDGLEVKRNQSFSFNEVVGPRTKARGFVSAENGRGVRVTGGGVGQAATTLYLALLQIPAGLEIEELSTYGSRFVGDYVSDGSQAVLIDYSGGTDFRVVNHAADMEIDMWVSGDQLYCTVTVDDDDDWFSDSDSDKRTLTARIPWSGDAGTLHNIELAAESVYDTTLSEGDRFSFNDVVGPRTKAYGYGSGYNGRGARVVGGGVAQVASAIWLAIRNDDDFTVVEKSTYGKKYNQEYVESAADAILTDYKSETDFAFRYNGDGTATLYTYVEGDTLRCDIAISD